MQEKIKRVITQGHIDPEDFKGVSTLLFPVYALGCMINVGWSRTLR